MGAFKCLAHDTGRRIVLSDKVPDFRIFPAAPIKAPWRSRIIVPMSRYMRAGMISLALLLLSRVFGLARESALAAAFGVSALADVVVVMLTLPDLVAGTLASGVLGFVLLPWWSRQTSEGQKSSRHRVMGLLLLLGCLLAVWIVLAPHQLAYLLAPGLAGHDGLIEAAMRWSAFALPAALAASLWYTHLQHERDFVGMYGMNIVHTSVILMVLIALVFVFVVDAADVVTWMGAGLLAAMVLRLAFLSWRTSRVVVRFTAPNEPVSGLPGWHIWAWTLLATGLPVALPVIARSLVSETGAGALSTFNYAWKLIELPNLLAIQLVSSLAFPAIARAHAEGRDFHTALKKAFMLAWTLACAAALALFIGSHPLATLLFGWGNMRAEHVAEIAQWSAWGAWTLLPQALIAVLVTALATLQKMRAAAFAYALALMVLSASGAHEPWAVMGVMTLALASVAAAMLAFSWRDILPALAWREMAVPGLLCALLGWLGTLAAIENQAVILMVAGLAALVLMGASAALSPTLRTLVGR